MPGLISSSLLQRMPLTSKPRGILSARMSGMPHLLDEGKCVGLIDVS